MKNNELHRYVKNRLYTLAKIRKDQEKRHDFRTRPLNSAERGFIRGIKELRCRGEDVREYTRAFNEFTNECNENLYLV